MKTARDSSGTSKAPAHMLAAPLCHQALVALTKLEQFTASPHAHSLWEHAVESDGALTSFPLLLCPSLPRSFASSKFTGPLLALSPS